MILSPEHCSCPLIEEGLTIANSPICSGTIVFMLVLESFLRGRCDISSPCERLESKKDLAEEYDFIVVGAGAAGPIVASRLSEDHSYKVLLLEAGGPEPIGAKIPSFYRTFWSNENLDWRYRTEPADYCLDQGSQGCNWPRGKVLGGCTVLNGMMYHRGHPADYDDWVAAGAHGWGWEDNLPFFDMTEGNRQIGSLVSGKYHSDQGPLPVQQFNYQPPALFHLLDAINETGYPVIADMNDPNTPEGFVIAQTFNADGQRYTAARAFLKPESERPNLHVKMHAQVTRVLFEGKRAVGVEYANEDGTINSVRASKEVILSAGALNSPQILLHSGIGPRETLERFDIPVVADLPVGQNLRNHVGVTFNFLLTALEDTRILDWAVATDYMLQRNGPMSGTGITQLTGVLYSSLADRAREQPDLQFFFNGFYAECSETGQIGEPGSCAKGVNVSANAVSLLPRSVGFLTINSSNPLDYPVFYPQFFSHPDDMVMVKDGARLLQRIFESPTLQEKYGIKLDPDTSSKCDKLADQWSDEWLECMIRYNTDPQNHQLGTAAIGSVVDTRLKVYGVDGLRVIDASSMPTQPTGNPQAAIMMVAERGAHHIREDYAQP